MRSTLSPPKSSSSTSHSRIRSQRVVLLAFLGFFALGASVERVSAASPPPLYMLNPSPTFDAPDASLWIAPFPVPFDTSRAAVERWKTLNLPKPGMTTVAPLPPPVPFWAPSRGDAQGSLLKRRFGMEGQRGDSLPEVGDYVHVDQHPVPIEYPEPKYPEDARRAGIRGSVVVQGVVLRDGSVARAKVVKSVPALDQAALECFRKWRFKPAMSLGQPVPVWIAVPFRFE